MIEIFGSDSQIFQRYQGSSSSIFGYKSKITLIPMSQKNMYMFVRKLCVKASLSRIVTADMRILTRIGYQLCEASSSFEELYCGAFFWGGPLCPKTHS